MRVPRNTADMDVQEQLVVKKKVEFNLLVHKMQLFQREVLHFTNNLEYYIKNSALKKCCQELNAKLQGMQRPDSLRTADSGLENAQAASQKTVIDMDELIKLHKNFQNQVLRRCMLDHTLRYFKRELNTAMDNVIEFRRICKKYFLCKVPGEEDDDDEAMEGRSATGLQGSKRRRNEREGMGLLKVTSPDFMGNLRLCVQELVTVRTRFKHTMQILMKGLSITENNRGDIKFLSEAFIRFNFNYFYHTEGGSRRP